MLNKKFGLVTVVMVVFILLLSACGSGKANSSTGENEKAKGEKQSLLDQIKEKGEMSVAMGGKYPPFNLINENNELDGFDVDIAKEIAKRLGVKPKFVTTEWDAIITGLVTKKYDMILGSMTITEERKQKADFVQYYTSGTAIIVPEDSDIKGKEDLKNKTVGVGLGTTHEKKAREVGAEVKTYSAGVDAFNDMINGRVDAVLSDELLAAYGIKKKDYPFKIVGEKLMEERIGIAVRKEDDEFKKKLEEIMDEMREDGTYTEISKKWFDRDIR